MLRLENVRCVGKEWEFGDAKAWVQDHWEWAGGFSPGLVSHPQTITLFVSRYSFSLLLLAMRWDMWGLNQWPLHWTVLLVRPRGEESLNHPITREVLVCFFCCCCSVFVFNSYTLFFFFSYFCLLDYLRLLTQWQRTPWWQGVFLFY